MTIKQMAIRITRETYPIAVACLPADFAVKPMNIVLGRILVINSPEKVVVPVERPRFRRGYIKRDDECDESQEVLPVERMTVGLVNSWMEKKTFKKDYRVVNKDEKVNGDKFVEVEAYISK